MKIKKFNENISSDWTIKLDKLAKFETEIEKMKNELKQHRREIFPFLADYLILNPQLQEDQDIEMDEMEITVEIFRNVDQNLPYYQTAPKDAVYEIVYYPDEQYADDEELKSAYMNKSDVEDFNIFIKDQEAYKDAKKYNL
jgi:hypothetical protein